MRPEVSVLDEWTHAVALTKKRRDASELAYLLRDAIDLPPKAREAIADLLEAMAKRRRGGSPSSPPSRRNGCLISTSSGASFASGRNWHKPIPRSSKTWPRLFGKSNGISCWIRKYQRGRH